MGVPALPTPPRLQGLRPLMNERTRVVVLGSFPGVASLRAAQYYGHERNQFWPLLGALWRIPLASMDYTARVERALERGLGLWDVYASCVRVGSLDRSIEAPLWNDLSELQRRSPALQAIAHNGGESARAMRRTGALGVCVYRLPSSSPANASWSFERKLAAWRVVFEAHEVM